MKKLFTLFALLTCFLGANAQKYEQVYTVDYASNEEFPFYVMGYAPKMVEGIMVDDPTPPFYKLWRNNDEGFAKVEDQCTEVTVNGVTLYAQTFNEIQWRQYFIADLIPTKKLGKYKVVAYVKASEACNIEVTMGWGWGGNESKTVNVAIPAGEEFQKVEWNYEEIGGTSCNLVAKPGTSKAIIEWQSVTVYEKQKEGAVVKEYDEHLKNGDAEQAWPAWSLEETNGVNINWRGNRTGEICAWALTMGKNNDSGTREGETEPLDGRARPFPADIEAEVGNESNHVFVVHADQTGLVEEKDANSYKWANQFWIQSPKEWKQGEKVVIKFRYKASTACTVETQIHKQHPSDYLHWQAVGNLEFTTSWQEFKQELVFDEDQATGWSLAMNLNTDDTRGQVANTFYFDDLQWLTPKLQEGYFVAGINTEDESAEYDYDGAIKFEQDPENEDNVVATIGKEGDAKSYVSEIMISTVRGDDDYFMDATLTVDGTIVNDPDEWVYATKSSLSKLTLPGLGVWKIWIDDKSEPGTISIAFQMLEGAKKDPVDIVTNASAIVVNGAAREDLKDEWDSQNSSVKVREDADPGDNLSDEHGLGGAGHEGQTWDNQFFIVANRTLAKGEATVLKFKYKANKAAKTSTQCHVAPGAYKFWDAIGDVNFTTDWQDFDADFTVPDEADGMQSIAFNLAEIKEACDYEIKDFQWYLKGDENTEGKTWKNLINATGTDNFKIKVGAGTSIVDYGTDGISTVTSKKSLGSAVIYNLAGQRVSNGFKGIVVKDGKKYVK